MLQAIDGCQATVLTDLLTTVQGRCDLLAEARQHVPRKQVSCGSRRGQSPTEAAGRVQRFKAAIGRPEKRKVGGSIPPLPR